MVKSRHLDCINEFAIIKIKIDIFIFNVFLLYKKTILTPPASAIGMYTMKKICQVGSENVTQMQIVADAHRISNVELLYDNVNVVT